MSTVERDASLDPPTCSPRPVSSCRRSSSAAISDRNELRWTRWPTSSRRQHSEIDICTVDSLAWEERVILHELSHAWAAHFLTPSHKDAFRTLRHFEYWQDYEHADWRFNGTEQAAEIMVWALSDHPVHVAQIDHASCPELRAAYIALTGLSPLHGYTARCNETSTDRRS